ncbi:hypothetical protein NUACC21_69980 [Scytonema sp. NUACC21]
MQQCQSVVGRDNDTEFHRFNTRDLARMQSIFYQASLYWVGAPTKITRLNASCRFIIIDCEFLYGI